ncbi:TonB-dependent receptor [Pedobacter hiemivivus]|uniref:TonB-dependent receptor n=1 Tax=Pedobacter hiemivivus TaxID=2530454 RepID=A0A4R0ND49_9SPHI|nr:TonB-dependent receptor [Pedobacter hiemivivus]TCC97617.1 TonB-dependent receptor [Pedobacter hiemivivus]
MKLTYLTLLMVFNTMLLFAQKPYAIKGSVRDTMATYKLINTTITLLNQKDSTLVKFTRANAEGSFAINDLRSGKFILLVTYPGYADYAENFTLDTINQEKDFNDINLILRSTLLEGVIIKGNAAITFKGDTTEFNAGSYNIQPNSKVEDLLKQLPGVQIDKDGRITAQGEKVNKVLVDGEEFFGDDPTLVTKNLRGDMIDKVQLYDKKSDQAAFTGIDDGEKSKTINLKLKEDKKNGYFGKLNAGIGTKDFYQNQATVNVFKGKQKYAAYGTIGNTNESFGNNISMGSVEFSEDGGMMMSMEGGDDFDMGGGAGGISIKRNAGLHYDSKWKDKYGINTNYKLGSVSSEGENNSLSINALPGQTNTSKSDQKSSSFSFNQKLDGTLSMRLDSSSTLKLTVSGSLKNNDSTDDYESSTQREDNSFLNRGKRTINNESDEKGFNATAFWAKKLKKKGRTVSVNVKQSFKETTGTGFLNSKNEFLNIQNKPDSTVYIDQYKTSDIFKSSFSTNATYTEPISKALALVLNYGLNLNNSSSNKKSFNKDIIGNYNDLDEEYSNNFKMTQLSNNAGLNFNYRAGKSIVIFGTRLNAVRFKQVDLYEDTTLKRSFINWSPQVNYSYNFSRSTSLRVSYNGNTSQPGMEQIQPYRANTDPLYIVLGNPNLSPSFSNSFGISYSSFKILTEQVLMVNGNFGFTSSAITTNIVTDKAGKTTAQAINMTGKTPINFSLNVSAGRKIKEINLNIEARAGGNYNYSISNNSLNTSKSFNYSVGPSINKYTDKYSIQLSLSPSYNTSSTSLVGVKNNNDSYGANGNFELMARLPGKVELRTNGEYQYTGKSQAFNESLNRLIWNASINKKFLKTESLNLSLSGKDLLNQNSGFSRSVYNNTINQSNSTTIQRYFMLSLAWDFNKMGGA